MKTKILISAALLSGLFSLNAQHNSLYTQYNLNGLVVNPAFAGRNEILEADLLHRRQWTGIDGSPINTSVSIHSPLKDKKTNVGLSVVSDKIGFSSNQFINGVYAYRFRMKNTFYSLGLQAGVNISRTDWESLRRTDATDLLIQGQNKTHTGLTTGAGFYMYNELYSFGLSMPYIVNSNGYKAIGQSPMLASGAVNIPMKDSSTIRPSFLVRYEKGSPVQFDFGVSYFWRQKFGAGFNYRYLESGAVTLEYLALKDFRVAYSYDFAINGLKTYHNGSHELILRFFIKWKKKEEESKKEGETETK